MENEDTAFSYNERWTSTRLSDGSVRIIDTSRPDAMQHKCLVLLDGPGNFTDPTPHSYTIKHQSCSRATETRFYGTSPNGSIMVTDGRYGSRAGVDANIDGGVYPLPSTKLYGRSTMLAQAQARLFGKLRTSGEILVDAAEWKQTKQLVSSTADLRGRVTSFIEVVSKDIRKGLNRKQRALEYATSRWLEYRYGMLPAIGSVYSALDALGKRVVDEPVKVSETFRHNYETAATTYRSGEFSHPVKIKVTGSERMKLVYTFVPPGAGAWNYSSLNPASVAWELTTLSFVADWVFAVGDNLRYLEDWGLFKVGFLSGYSTYTVLEEQSITCNDTRSVAVPSDLVYRCNTEIWKGESSRYYKHFNRQIHTSLPYGRPPLVRSKFGLNQALDSLALTHVLLRKRIKDWSR